MNPNTRQGVLCANPTQPPRILVCEKHGKWARRLLGWQSRAASSHNIAIRQVRVLNACLAELEAAPASLLVVDVTPANLAEVLKLTQKIDHCFPCALWIAVTEQEGGMHPEGVSLLKEITREAGAVYFGSLPDDVVAIASIAQRHVAQVPQSKESLATQVWQALPWQEAAEKSSGLSQTLKPETHE